MLGFLLHGFIISNSSEHFERVAGITQYFVYLQTIDI